VAVLLQDKCPDCGSVVTYHFALLTNLGVGIICFARCPFCFHHGDSRSLRRFIEVDEATYLWAAHHNLYIIQYKKKDEEDEEEDSGNIMDELDDEEEYSRSKIGFKGDDDEEDE